MQGKVDEYVPAPLQIEFVDEHVRRLGQPVVERYFGQLKALAGIAVIESDQGACRISHA